ncbi:DDE family transposase [Rhodovulum imhoffii]|uniref:DDE family transposase n=1 Tax=Rhodovulum imhoffii TaxID=365340 RepID=A0A2T5BRD0_9RHOB|nr:DDE family transposase [Rhodovulum imhoffii]
MTLKSNRATTCRRPCGERPAISPTGFLPIHNPARPLPTAPVTGSPRGSKGNARKHGGPKRRVWRKIHIGFDEKTLEVRAVDDTTSNVGDAPMLPELLDQIPSDQDIGSVTADGAYDTRKCHDAIAARGAHAVIPPRKNAKPWKPTSPGAIARNDAVNASRYLGRSIWKRWGGYRRRSRVESKMHYMKRLGQSSMARDFDRQVANIQIRVAVLNRDTAPDIPVTEPVG